LMAVMSATGKRGAGGGGCSLEEGRTFFTAMVAKLVDPQSEEWVDANWQEWKNQLGLN